MSAKNKALLLSFLRVLIGCLVTAYTAVVGFDPPWTVDSDEALKIGNALWGATALTAFNYFRKGETRFGKYAQDTGMGGEDTLTPPDGKVQVPPDGERVDLSRWNVATPPEADGVPVQTDNGPKEGDEFIEPEDTFGGEMR